MAGLFVRIRKQEVLVHMLQTEDGYRRKLQNWYYVTHILAHPVEPRDRWVQTHATDG